MKNLFLSFLCLFAVNVFADESKLGVGFILGDPTALSVKWYRTVEHALDLQVSFVHNDYIVIWADTLYHFPGLFGKEKLIQGIIPYFGFGAVAVAAQKTNHPKGNFFDKRDDKFAVGARIPFGIEWIWSRAPLGIGFEITPGIVIAPATIGLLMGGLSLRYYF